MKLGISNLAWSADDEDAAFRAIAEAGFAGIEVAPTRIADWSKLDATLLANYRRKCEDFGFQIPSMQAVFFGRPDAQLIDGTDKFEIMLSHTSAIGRVGAALGAKVAVFGAPRNRLRGATPREDAFAIAVERLRQLGEVLRPFDVTLAMEPVPTYYGADFIENVGETAALVEACDHPNIALHLDTACIELAGDNLDASVGRFGGLCTHFHVAEPDLKSFANPVCDHVSAANQLKVHGYAHWVVIEMREQPEHGIQEVATALSFVRQTYGT